MEGVGGSGSVAMFTSEWRMVGGPDAGREANGSFSSEGSSRRKIKCLKLANQGFPRVGCHL